MRVRWLAPLAVIPLAGLFSFGMSQNLAQHPSPLLGQPAPRLAGTTLEGAALDLKSLRGHPVVVNFWASWCGPCQAEQPTLLAAYRAWHSQRVEFVGVLFQDQKAPALAFARRWGDGWPTVDDGGSGIAIDYGVSGIPETFVIDRRGTIVARMVGPADSAALDSVLGQVTR